MLRPSPYCDAVSRRDDTKTTKPIINEAFVASSGDIITDYNDLYGSVSSAAGLAAGPDGCLPELDYPPLLQSRVSMVYYVLFAEVFFLFSHCTPQGA